MRSTFRSTTLPALLFLGAVLPVHAQHQHVNAGARSATPGSPLIFVNGGSFNADSGYLVHLTFTDSPRYGPIYVGGSALTFASLAVEPDNGGPEPSAALPGTHVVAVLETLEGPAGGTLSLWDSDGFFDATEITWTVEVGTVDGSRRFSLSENDGSEGVDPYGHIHGRRFSATLPGLYRAGFRLVDTSGNGAGGGPVHAPSELTFFHFQAGITIARLVPRTDGWLVVFGTQTGRTYLVETAAALTGAPWKAVTEPLAGTGRLVEVLTPAFTDAAVFFRLRVE